MLGTQLNRHCLEILHAQTVQDFVRISAQFGQSIGFHTMAAMVVTDHSPYLSEFRTVTNAPPDYMPTFEDAESARIDPVSQFCKRSSSPLVWTRDTYIAAGRADLWEQQATFGLQSGICVAFHLPRGRHFMWGFTSDRRTCVEKRATLGMSLDVQMYAAYAQAAAFDLCVPYVRNGGEVLLAKGELDALRWSVDGLSDTAIGEAMGISETEVLLRLRRATVKLGCSTIYEAALRAIRLGLVSCS